MKIKYLSSLIGKAYYKVYNSIRENKHTHYWFKGGRGSLKSAFVCIIIIWLMTKDHSQGKITHCVAMRKVKDTIKDSIFTNLLWAIDLLGLSSKWKHTTSPMKLWIGENTILFRGCANQSDHTKIKSIKFKKGKPKYAIFEEVTEFFGMDEILSICQSIFRGTDEAFSFYMYNPPPSRNNWVNEESRKEEDGKYIHHSTYLSAPAEWLGNVFIEEAKKVKKYQPRKYRHMYLAEEIGEGLEIYPPFTADNPEGLVEYRTITDEEIKNFTKIERGFDPGYSHAACYAEVYYDKEKEWIYIVDEVYLYGASNYNLYTSIKKKAGTKYISADNEDPRLINEFNLYGLNMGKTKKGKDSKDHGIKWLQDRGRIIIDKKRTPNIKSDFENYEFKKNKEGKIIYDYPDEPDGCLKDNTKILTDKGYKKIKDLVNTNGYVYSLNVETNKIEKQKYYNCRKTGTNRKLYEVTTKSGKTFKCTSNHPILTDKGYKQLKDFKIGDKIIDVSNCMT